MGKIIRAKEGLLRNVKLILEDKYAFDKAVEELENTIYRVLDENDEKHKKGVDTAI